MSGAGKTTIARCIVGLISPTRGSVLIDGRPAPPLRRRSTRQRAHIQYIGQEASASFEPRRPVLARDILDHIDHYRRTTRASVLAISHQIHDLLTRADRVALVDTGQIVEVDTPDRLLAAPSSPVLRDLLA